MHGLSIIASGILSVSATPRTPVEMGASRNNADASANGNDS